MKAMRNLALCLVVPATLLATATAYAETKTGPFGFQVQVTLSPKAAERLSSLSEGITLSSFYYGEAAKKPTKAEIRAAEQDGQQAGQIEIPGDTVTIAGMPGTAEMPGRALGKKEAALYGRNVVRVNVNVFSARLHSEDNLLDCALFDDEVAIAKAKPVEILCRLIGEE